MRAINASLVNEPNGIKRVSAFLCVGFVFVTLPFRYLYTLQNTYIHFRNRHKIGRKITHSPHVIWSSLLYRNTQFCCTIDRRATGFFELVVVSMFLSCSDHVFAFTYKKHDFFFSLRESQTLRHISFPHFSHWDELLIGMMADETFISSHKLFHRFQFKSKIPKASKTRDKFAPQNKTTIWCYLASQLFIINENKLKVHTKRSKSKYIQTLSRRARARTFVHQILYTYLSISMN